MICYLVEDNTVKSVKSTHSAADNNILRKWKHSVRGRMVYAANSNFWYLLNNKGFWTQLGKPDVVSMAELLNAIQPISLMEVQSDISSDSFWTE